MRLVKYAAVIKDGFLKYSSLTYLSQRLHPLEILVYIMFDTVVTQQTFTVIQTNLNLMKVLDGVRTVLEIKVLGILIHPIIMVWTLSALHSGRMAGTGKVAMAVLYLMVSGVLLAAMDQRNNVQLLQWGPWHNMLWSAGLLVLNYLFSVLFRAFLRKRGLLE